MDSVFLQIGLVTIIASVLGIAARLLHQPIVLAYIAAGILLGGGGLHVITNADLTQDIASIGIVFLLFLVGLELDVGKIRKLGRVVLISGLLQMVLTFVLAFAIVNAVTGSATISFYLALATVFSSTAVVLKRLADRKEMSALFGKVSIGILLLQDMVAIICLMVISATGKDTLSTLMVGVFLIKGFAFLFGTWLITRFLLGRLFRYIARSTELLFLTSVAWAFSFAMVADMLGFSKEIGAFMAGISLATLPYSLEIIGRVKPLKDFFLVIFFVVLGLEVSWHVISDNLLLAVLLTGLVVFVKSFIGSAAMTASGYPRRPSYLMGVGLGQMSEFSLLLVLLGASLGHIPQDIVGLTAGILVFTIILNSYWTDLNRHIYPLLVRPLRLFARKEVHHSKLHTDQELENHTLLFGSNRMGNALLKRLAAQGKDILVVDHNPDIINRLEQRGIPSVYGDIEDFQLLEELGLTKAEIVISTVPNLSANLYLIDQTRTEEKGPLVVVTADDIDEALELYEAGADYVVLPHMLGGEEAARILETLTAGDERLQKGRTSHIQELELRLAELGV